MFALAPVNRRNYALAAQQQRSTCVAVVTFLPTLHAKARLIIVADNVCGLLIIACTVLKACYLSIKRKIQLFHRKAYQKSLRLLDL